jgi:hypothetical protein
MAENNQLHVQKNQAIPAERSVSNERTKSERHFTRFGS